MSVSHPKPVKLPGHVLRRVVMVPGGCWFWIGSLSDDGYPTMQLGSSGEARTVRVHRWICELRWGPLEAGTKTLHSCDETSCVLPEHLRPGTHQQNMAQMVDRGRSAGPHHWPRAEVDVRGPAGRARAIRDALQDGYDAARLRAALAAGRGPQLYLWDSEPTPGS